MLNKRVKWMLVQFAQDGHADWRFGKVVAEKGDYFVIEAEKYGAIGLNPFVVKRGADIELA